MTRSGATIRAGATGVGGLLLGVALPHGAVEPTPVPPPAPVVVTLDPPVPTGPPLVVTTPAPAASPGSDWRHWYDPTEGRVRPVWGTLGSDGAARFDPMDRRNDHLTAYRR